MKKSMSLVHDNDNFSQQQNQISPVSYYQSTANSHDGPTNKDENGVTEITLRKSDGVKTNSKLQPVSNGKEENTYLKHNGDSNGPSNVSQTVPEYPFSVARVWISITVVIVLNIVVVAVIGPLLSQYLFQYFLQERMPFHNMTTNSTNATSTCQDSTNSEIDSINTVQKEASNVYLYANIVTNIPASIVCLFAGSITDFLGRRCLLICSVLGLLTKTAILCIVIKLHLDVQLIYIGAAVEGLMGSYYSTTLTVIAIVTDITTDESSKAVRFAIIEALMLVFSALTQLAVGYLIEKTDFFIPVLMCVCILVIPLLTIIFLLPETLQQKGEFSWNIWRHVKHTFGFYFSKVGGNHRRLQFITGLAAYFTITFTFSGKVAVETFFLLTRPICWDSIDIGIFNSARMVGMSLTAVITLRVCKNRLPLEIIGVICGVSSVCSYIFMGFADSTLLVYLSMLVGIFVITAIIIPRAILSQIASPSEQGALFSSMSCTEAVANMVSSTVYILIYDATIDTFKGATFMVIAGIKLIFTILLGIMVFLRTSTRVDYENNIDDPVDRKSDISSNDDNLSKL